MATGAGFEAIVLAAGSGSRFGGGKLLAAWKSGVLLDGALAAAFAAPARGVTVVTGADADAIAAAAQAFDPRARIVHAAEHAEGMGASLRAGIASLPADTAAVFVFLGDMPCVPQAVLPALAEALAKGAPAAAPVFNGRRGNPVLLGRELFPDLLALQGDEGARRLLQNFGDRLALIAAADDGVLFDVDRQSDLDKSGKW